MKHCSLNITIWMIIKYILKVLWLSYFGSKKTDTESGRCEKEDYVEVRFYIFHQKDFLIDAIWWENADEELQNSRAAFEEADYKMMKYI